jgi:hypothetical protein
VQWSDIQFDPPRKTLRQFAGLWLTCLGGLSVWEGAIKSRVNVAIVLAALAISIGPLGLIWPRLVRPIYVGWMVLAFPIGWTVSQLILALLYYGLFTPIGLIFRAIGRDPLHRAHQRGLETYWSTKEIPSDPRRYFKQF